MSDTALAATQPQAEGSLIKAEDMEWTLRYMRQVRETLCPGMNDVQLAYFQGVVKSTGLSPLTDPPQIHASLFNGKFNVMTGIDGWRMAAMRTGKFGGIIKTEFFGRDNVACPVWLGGPDHPPLACRVTLVRIDWKHPVDAIALMHEWNNGRGEWKTKPAHMLSVRAEKLALRKAFPGAFNDLDSELPVGEDSEVFVGEQRPRSLRELWLAIRDYDHPVTDILFKGKPEAKGGGEILVRFIGLPDSERAVIEEAAIQLEGMVEKLAGKEISFIFEFSEAPESEDEELKRLQKTFFAIAKDMFTSVPAKERSAKAATVCGSHLTICPEKGRPSWSASTIEQKRAAVAYLKELSQQGPPAPDDDRPPIPPEPMEPDTEEADYDLPGGGA